jgi:hypothetical protein
VEIGSDEVLFKGKNKPATERIEVLLDALWKHAQSASS